MIFWKEFSLNQRVLIALFWGLFLLWIWGGNEDATGLIFIFGMMSWCFIFLKEIVTGRFLP